MWAKCTARKLKNTKPKQNFTQPLKLKVILIPFVGLRDLSGTLGDKLMETAKIP
jgi:hypothetical protein